MPQATIRPPDLSMPEGGGVLHGLDVRVEAADYRGTATMAIPLPVPAARGLAPRLTLTYDSSGGNGLFGAGAQIALPSIGRSTATGIPTYTDADTLTSDAGLLVEKGEWRDGLWVPDERTVTDDAGDVWLVRDYLPRQQAAFPLIERWMPVGERVGHWRMVSADNVESRFGVSAQARIADPDDPGHILEWLIEESLDAKGNRIAYRYRAEDGAGVPSDASSTANRYPDRILYGNYHGDSSGADAFAFEIVFDYGDYDLDDLDQPSANPYIPSRPWPARDDGFSTFRPGFDLRTNRLCRGILTFHHFPAALGDDPCLTAATRFDYAASPYLSCLASMTRTGYRRQGDGSYVEEALPAATFAFTAFDPPATPAFRRIDVEGQADLPGYLAPGSYQPVDLDGEGIAGFLQSNGTTTLYYAPLGDGRYAAAATPATFPDFSNLANPALTLTDIDGDGRIELLVTSDTGAGFFRRRGDGGWSGFEPMDHVPTTEQDNGIDYVDLTGDGLVDLMTVRRTELGYYRSLGEAGFAPLRGAARQPDFPSSQANGPAERVAFADMMGDGLAHRVRVTDGEVAVWPNLGYGCFGAKRVLAGAPVLDGNLQAARCYFADLDGSGAADIVVAASDRLVIYRNQSGNGFAPPFTVPLPFRLGDNDQLSFADILGNGTTAIVATRLSPVVEHWFCDLAAPIGAATGKPYLLAGTDNGFGGGTTIGYRSSASFYLQDRREGRPWLTRLPFAVQLVETLTATDAVTGAETRQRWRYHDGYFDGLMRSVRGFGYIEHWEKRVYAPFAAASGWPVARVNADLDMPGTYVRSWYANGAYADQARLGRQYAREYWQGDPDAGSLPPTRFDPAIISAGARALIQAQQALAGRAVRTEIYAGDDTASESRTPCLVSAACHDVRLLQAPDPRGWSSLLVRDRETIRYLYDRDAADPRIEHDLLLLATLPPQGENGASHERRCSVSYGRRSSAPAPVYPEQAAIACSVAESWSIVTVSPFHLIGAVYEQRSLDIGGLTPPATGPLYTFDEIDGQVTAALAASIPYGTGFTPDLLQSRLASHMRRFFWNEAQDAVLPIGAVSARALLHHEENAVFSQEWLDEVFGARVSTADLADLAGLIDDGTGYWWNPGLIQSYFPPSAPALFYQPSGTASASQTTGIFARSETRYDAPYALLPVAVDRYIDPATMLSSTAEIDYQALHPSRLTDANGVVRQALYTPLALVLATSVFKPASGSDPRIGDGDLAEYVPRPGTLDQVLANPQLYLQQAGTYHLYAPSPVPATSLTLARTRFVSDGIADAPIEIALFHADASGGTAEHKKKAAPDDSGAPRWIASDRVVPDARGEATQTYLPYYATTPNYLPQQVLANGNLVAPPRIDRRDPLGRIVRTTTPKGFFTRTAQRAWSTTVFDEDDTVLDAPFYLDFMAHYPADPSEAQRDEKAALDKAAAFYNTPETSILDSAGHPIRRIRSNLGNVPADYFAGIVTGDVTSADLWAALIDAGYLVTTQIPAGTWVTTAFQPFVPGFTLTLPPPYAPFAAPAATLLTQHCLTTLLVPDRAGRVVQATDPRLFLTEVQGGGATPGQRYAYPMAAENAAWTDSGDAGGRWQLLSCFGSVVLAFDALGRRQQQLHDGLQRLTSTVVTDSDGTSRTTQLLTYGEGQPGAAAANLMGQIYRIDDEAGTQQFAAYTILGQPTRSARQFAAEYKTPPDWSGSVPLDPQVFVSDTAYDALARPIGETLPDTSVIVRAYQLSGQPASIDVTLPGGAAKPFVTAIDYAAGGQRERIVYGNGVIQTLGYEATTARLLTLSATRPAAALLDPTVQSVDYTYDPVGNVTSVRDRTAQLLFAGGSEPEAPGDYRYDALYRLASATGLQHPDIDATTHVTGFMQSLYAELSPPGGPPVTLEPYAETYAYDLSGNLISTHHAATSASFDRDGAVEPTSNRLADTPYDANGNSLSITLGAAVPIGWTTRNQLATIGPIERDGGRFDRDYNGYDLAGDRVRRVVEHSPGASDPPDSVEQEFTAGSYILRRTTTGTDSTVASLLRIADGTACFAVTDTLSAGAMEIRYQLDDRLGSTSVEIGADAGILSYEAYYPFGGTAIIAGNDPAVVARKLLRYSGQRVDENTGLYAYPARDYAPWQGRWLSADPSGASDGLNLYQFVGGNPMTLIDPDGRGKDDPKSLDSAWNQRALTSFMRSALHNIVMGPAWAFYYAPIQLNRRLRGSEAERRELTTNTAARREEMRVFYFNLLGAYGFDPTPYVPPILMPYIRPQRQPWAMTWTPGGYPMHNEFRARIRQPETLPGMAGGMFGSFLVVGGTLNVLRQLIRPGRFSIGGMVATMTAGFVLQSWGQAEESDRVYRDYRAAQDNMYFWQRTRRPQLAGLERRLTYDAYNEARAGRWWNDSHIATIAIAFTLAMMYRAFAPGRARATRTWANDQWANRRSGSASSSGGGGNRPTGVSGSTALVVRRPAQPPAIIVPPITDLVPYQRPVTALAVVRQQNRAIAIIWPRIVAVVPYVARQNAVQPYRAPVTAVVPYVPRPNALQIVPAVRPRGPGGVLFAGTLFGGLVAYQLYTRRTSNNP